MGNRSAELDAISTIVADLEARGIVLRTAQDSTLNGRTVRIDGRECVNFGSCSYFGLELDPRVRAEAIESVKKYGTQFSSSRSYLSAPPYRELEELLDRLFGGCTVITPNTTLAHLSGLPVLVHEDDAVVLDHQVHHTVRMAADLLRPHGVRIEVLPHTDMNRLEELIRELGRTHRSVWYLCDGVYSMHSDLAPMAELAELLERYAHFRLYVDDAHGMGWCGPHGRGYALSMLPSHPRLVVTTSLNKCFAAGGGALILPDEETRQRVNRIAGPMIFTGPLQPPMLGAAVASARIFLSPEIELLQARLAERIRLFNQLAEEHELLLIGSREAPIRFVGLGWPGVAADMVGRLLARGFWTNLAAFPAVSPKRSGVRSTLTLHQEPRDIRHLVDAFAEELPGVLERGTTSLEEVRRMFKLAAPKTAASTRIGAASSGLHLQHETTIEALDGDEWDRLLGDRGTFSAAGLRLLEEVFRDNPEPENNWEWHYWIVRDGSGSPILATFFTEALWKDDVLAPGRVSRRVEELRVGDPYLLTSRVLSMGSLLTEGDHLYLDRALDWQGALTLLLAAVNEMAESSGIRQLVLRDLASDDDTLGRLLRDRGFARLPARDSLVLELDWTSDDEYLSRLKRSHRRFQRKEVLPWEDAYVVEVLGSRGRRPEEDELVRLYELYRNVLGQSFELNTFPLPPRLFRKMLERREWEIVTLRLRREWGGTPKRVPDGFLAGYVGREHYVFLLAGLDYGLVRGQRLYRRVLRECIHRARAHGCRRLLLGMGSEQVKRSFGAERQKRSIYVHSDDAFSADVLAQIEADLAVGT